MAAVTMWRRPQNQWNATCGFSDAAGAPKPRVATEKLGRHAPGTPRRVPLKTDDLEQAF
jgi:hypothetical protein